MKVAGRLAIALTAGVAVTLGAQRIAAVDELPVDALGPGPVTVVVDIEHSVFHPSALTVEVGTEVRFVTRNGDPINHELIIGPPEVHARHHNGTEPYHDPVPGEISLAPDEQGVTAYRFDAVGVVEMACHLPGHYEFGMRGEIEVVAPAVP